MRRPRRVRKRKAVLSTPPRARRFEAALRRNLVGLVSEAKGLMGMEGIFVGLNAVVPNSFDWDIPTKQMVICE